MLFESPFVFTYSCMYYILYTVQIVLYVSLYVGEGEGETGRLRKRKEGRKVWGRWGGGADTERQRTGAV